MTALGLRVVLYYIEDDVVLFKGAEGFCEILTVFINYNVTFT